MLITRTSLMPGSWSWRAKLQSLATVRREFTAPAIIGLRQPRQSMPNWLAPKGLRSSSDDARKTDRQPLRFQTEILPEWQFFFWVLRIIEILARHYFK